MSLYIGKQIRLNKHKYDHLQFLLIYSTLQIVCDKNSIYHIATVCKMSQATRSDMDRENKMICQIFPITCVNLKKAAI